MSRLRKRPRPRAAQGEARPFAGMRPVPPHAAGVDLGAHEIVACVPDGKDPQIVRTLGPSTTALHTLADWFVDRGLQTVAMASTGVYGIALCEALDARGLACCLSSAQSSTRGPGRQSDVVDCQGRQPLHSDGVLAASLHPEADCVALRTFLRHRAHRIAQRAPHVLHMHKALFPMQSQ